MTTEQAEQESFLDRIRQYFPILTWLPEYDRGWLRLDMLAGTTLAAFTIPEAMAYAGLAGLPPQAGLYAGIAAPILYMLFGTSKQLAIGVTSAVSVLVASGLAFYAEGDLAIYAQKAALLALIVFVIALIARMLRLGFLVNFISEPVLLGFSSGAALYIASTQLPKMFGIHGCHGEFFERISCLLSNLDQTDLPTLLLGLAGLIIVIAGEHFYHKLPWSLIVVILSILLVTYTGLAEMGIAVAGDIPQGLPGISVPDFNMEDIRLLLPSALAIFLLAYVEGMSMARTFASKYGYRVDPDQELLALSMVNLGAGLTQAYPVAGSMSRTAVADSAGQKSPLAGGFSAVIIGIVVLFFTGFFANLPETILAAVVLVAVAGLFKRKELAHLYHIQRKEFWIAIIAMMSVLLFGMLEGVLIGVIISLLVLVARTSQSRLSVLGRVPETIQFADTRDHPEYRTVPGMMIIRIDEMLYFANATPIAEEIERLVDESEEELLALLLDLEMSETLDVSAAVMLSELHGTLAARDMRLMLTRVSDDGRALLERSGVVEQIGEENFFPRALGAVADHLEVEEIPVGSLINLTSILLGDMSEIYTTMATRLEEPAQSKAQSTADELDKLANALKAEVNAGKTVEPGETS